MPKLGFTGGSDDPEYSDNTEEIIPLTVDQPNLHDLDEWQEEE